MTENAHDIRASFAQAASEDTRGRTHVNPGPDGQLRVEAYAGQTYDPPILIDTTDAQWLAYRAHFDSMAAFLQLRWCTLTKPCTR